MAVSLAASAVGWIYFIYFFSIGYGLAIAAIATAIAIIFTDASTPPTTIFCATIFIYGIKLATYPILADIQRCKTKVAESITKKRRTALLSFFSISKPHGNNYFFKASSAFP